MKYSDKMQILNDYHRELSIDNPTTQTVELAEKLGLKVYRTQFSDARVSGKIEKNEEYGGESGYAIYVNADHSRNRRRFTIAHEIAHFIRHEENIGDGVVEDALYRSTAFNSRMEIEANKLAADILMPWTLLNLMLQDGMTEIKALAKRFEVSEQAMAFRLGVPQ